MPVVTNKSAIFSSAVFVCANASTNSTNADVTTTDGFTVSATGLRAGDTSPNVAGVFQMPLNYSNPNDPTCTGSGTYNSCPFVSSADQVDTK